MSTLLSDETVVLDALDFEVTCVAPPKEHAAHVLLITRCCRGETLLCAAHLTVIRLRHEARGGGVRCKNCGHQWRSFDEAAEVVPL